MRSFLGCLTLNVIMISIGTPVLLRPPPFELKFFHRYRKSKIDCLRFVMCPILAPVFQGFFFFFLRWPLTVLMKQTRQAVRAFKQSILFRCLWVFRRLLYEYPTHFLVLSSTVFVHLNNQSYKTFLLLKTTWHSKLDYLVLYWLCTILVGDHKSVCFFASFLDQLQHSCICEQK